MLCSAQITTPCFFTKPSSSGLTHPEVGWGLQLRHYCCRIWHTFPPSMPMWSVSLVKCFANTLKLLPQLQSPYRDPETAQQLVSNEGTLSYRSWPNAEVMNNTQLSLETGEIWAGTKSRRILLLIATSRAEEGGIIGILLPLKSARALPASTLRAEFQLGLKIIYLKSMATGLSKQNLTEAQPGFSGRQALLTSSSGVWFLWNETFNSNLRLKEKWKNFTQSWGRREAQQCSFTATPRDFNERGASCVLTFPSFKIGNKLRQPHQRSVW